MNPRQSLPALRQLVAEFPAVALLGPPQAGKTTESLALAQARAETIYPDLEAARDAASQRWRGQFIRTYLEPDIPQLGPRIAAETLRRFWTMLAHEQGQLLNAAKMASSLAVSGQTVARYLDLMCDLMLVRRLQPWVSHEGKRLIRSPKVYVRDSGLVHSLLGLSSLDALLAHPVAGGSWEGLVIENLIAAAPAGTQASFYRSAAGAEVDLLLELPGGALWAIEVKRSSAPTLSKGVHLAVADVKAVTTFVVYPGAVEFPLARGELALPLAALLARLAAQA